MQLTAALLTALAAVASTAPTGGSCPAPTRKFGIMALRSASPIHFAKAGAHQNQIALNLPPKKLDAQCADGVARPDAIFEIKDGELYLYGEGDKVQQVLVDRSGMGQGVVQYFNKAATTLGGRLELKGWAVDGNDNLSFNNHTLLACPNTADGSWGVWVDVGIEKPAQQEGCLGFVARTVKNASPVKCTYSTRS